VWPVPYDHRFVGHYSDQGDVAGAPEVARHRHTATRERERSSSIPSGPWLTVVAFLVVGVPFLVALARLLVGPSAHLTLPDDLALIDLHARRALAWKQQLGVFDHNNWNHPGPTYFYWLALVYRILGSGTRSLYVGATLFNGLSAVACVAVVRRRTSPRRTLWAAVWICALAIVLAAAGPMSTTYSESVLGALVSPWNPTVVLFPLLLVILLCAGAIDRSGASLVGALLAASFVAQTDISTLPVAAVLVAVSGGVWMVARLRARQRPDSVRGAGSWWGTVPVVAGLVGLVAMWMPPLIQQFTNHPGNLTVIWQFFNLPHPGQSLSGSLWSVATAGAVVVVGPGQVMRSILGGTPAHAALAVAVSLLTVAGATATVALAARDRNRFAVGIGVLVLVGWAASAVAVSHVVGFIFGYLVLWVAVLPVAALIGIGMVRLPLTGVPVAAPRMALCAVALVAGVVLTLRVLAIPSLTEASDPNVGHLAAFVEPRLVSGGRVMIGDAGAGTVDTQLLDTEEFIGLVNLLDQRGHRPTVNAFWKAQFGPGFLSNGHENRLVTLSTWTANAPALQGYVGRVGDMVVTVTDSHLAPVAVRS
jgi:hypothetical protein